MSWALGWFWIPTNSSVLLLSKGGGWFLSPWAWARLNDSLGRNGMWLSDRGWLPRLDHAVCSGPIRLCPGSHLFCLDLTLPQREGLSSSLAATQWRARQTGNALTHDHVWASVFRSSPCLVQGREVIRSQGQLFSEDGQSTKDIMVLSPSGPWVSPPMNVDLFSLSVISWLTVGLGPPIRWLWGSRGWIRQDPFQQEHLV